MHVVRVKLDQIASDDPSPMIINLILRDDGKPAHSIPFCGWWGVPKTNHWCRALIFKPDGKVDFGGDPEDDHDERYAIMPIHDKVFAIGARFYLEDLEDQSVSQFVIKEMTDLSKIH